MAARKKYKALYTAEYNRRKDAEHDAMALRDELARVRSVLAHRGDAVAKALPRDAKRHELDALDFECFKAAIFANSRAEPDDPYWPVVMFSWRGVPVMLRIGQ